MSEAGSNYICWSAILIDSVLWKVEKYYSQVYFKKSIYIKKEKKMIRYITDDLKNCSDDSDEE